MNSLNKLWEGINSVAKSLPGLAGFTTGKEVQTVIVKEIHTMAVPRCSRLFVRMAGLSGATAVIMAAYGAHAFKPAEPDSSQNVAFASGNKMHLIHSVALLAVPLTRKPLLVGTLLCLGIVLFSGSCYYHAMTGSTAIRRVTPYGGMCFIFGWLAMVL